jgi:peptidoglycan/LPS O-acetylase OafA/YrhL
VTRTAARPARLAGLDGLRAIAVVAFILYGTAHGGAFLGEPLASLVSRLEVLATALFFGLSGFLLYRPFVAARWQGTATPSLRHYAARRIGRILPAYWFALTVTGLTVGLPGFFSHAWWQEYLLLTPFFHWQTPLPGMGIAWSLSVIASFAAVLPLYAWLRRRRPPRVAGEAAVLAVLAAASLAVQAEYLQNGGTQGRLNITLPGMLVLFVLGMAAAVMSVATERRPGPASSLVRRWPGAVCWAPALLLYWLACRRLGLPPVGASIQAFTVASWLAALLLPALTATLLLLPAALGAGDRGLPGLVTSSPPVVWLGGLAYGLYLWFAVPLGPLTHSGVWSGATVSDTILLTAMTIVLTLPVALISRRFVEQPVNALTATLATHQGRSQNGEQHGRDEDWAPRPQRSAVAG